MKVKKKKEKAAVRGRQQKSQHISQPLPTGLWVGANGEQQQGPESLKHTEQGKAKAQGRAGIQDAHRVGLVRGISTRM